MVAAAGAFVGGGLVGVMACMVLALAAKPLNLGLGGNAAVGFLAGGAAMLLATVFSGGGALVALVPAAGAPLLLMAAIGLYLNARAR